MNLEENFGARVSKIVRETGVLTTCMYTDSIRRADTRHFLQFLKVGQFLRLSEIFNRYICIVELSKISVESPAITCRIANRTY